MSMNQETNDFPYGPYDMAHMIWATILHSIHAFQTSFKQMPLTISYKNYILINYNKMFQNWLSHQINEIKIISIESSIECNENKGLLMDFFIANRQRHISIVCIKPNYAFGIWRSCITDCCITLDQQHFFLTLTSNSEVASNSMIENHNNFLTCILNSKFDAKMLIKAILYRTFKRIIAIFK